MCCGRKFRDEEKDVVKVMKGRGREFAKTNEVNISSTGFH